MVERVAGDVERIAADIERVAGEVESPVPPSHFRNPEIETR